MANVISGEITAATSEEAAYARTNARIDNLMSAVTVDSEVIDIRDGADGVTYRSAGEAVRSVASGIGTADNFMGNQLYYYNINDISTVTTGYYINYTQASGITYIEMNQSYGYTDFIPVGQVPYIAHHPWNCSQCVIFYDTSKNPISVKYYDNVTKLSGDSQTITTRFWYTITPPEGAAFAVFNVDFNQQINTMVVRGSTVEDIPDEYKPHKEEMRSEEFKNFLDDHYAESDDYVISEPGNYTSTADNTFVGNGTPAESTGIAENVAIGANAMASIVADSVIDNQSGRYNVAVGKNTCQSMTTGNHNTACGYQSMKSVTTGSYNTAIGEDSLMTIGAGSSNVAVGCRALQSATAGNNNTAIGQSSCYWDDTKHPTGSNNTSIGAHSGCSDGNGSNNIAVGYFAKANQGLNDTIVVGNNIAAQRDGEMILGHSNTSSVILVCNGQRKVLRFAEDGRVLWENYIAPSQS